MNILIVNLHSALNLGDEAIMQQTVILLRQKYPGANITLMANHPESWKVIEGVNVGPSLIHHIEKTDNVLVKIKKIVRLFIGVLFRKPEKYFTKNDDELREIYFLIKSAELVLSAGGGNFYSNTLFGNNFSLNVFLLIISGLLGKTVVMLPQSFGPLKTQYQSALLKAGLGFPKKIYVREEQSSIFLEEIGINPLKLQLVPDLALSCSNVGKKCEKDNAILKIGITIIDRGSQDKAFKLQASYQLAIINYVRKIIASTNAEIFIFVQCYGPSRDQNDNLISTYVYNQLHELSTRVHLLNGYSISNDLLLDLAEMDIMISSRMHSAIFAILNNVPAILIGYQPKSKGLFDLFNLDKYFIDIDKVSTDALYTLSMDLIRNRKEISEQMSSTVNYYRTMIIDTILADKWLFFN